MAYLVLQSMEITPDWNYGGSTCRLRVYSSQAFYENSTGQYVAQGNPQRISSFCQEYTCTISDEVVTLPPVTLATTTDSSSPTTTYSLILYSNDNTKRYVFQSNISVDPYLLESDVTPSVTLSGGTPSASMGDYIPQGITNEHPFYNLTGFSESTTLRVVKFNGTRWVVTDSAGATLFQETAPSDPVAAYPYDVAAWTAVGGTGTLVATENANITAGTWEWLTMSNQGSYPIAQPLNAYYTIPQVDQLISRNQSPIANASFTVAGKTRLSQDPAVAGLPYAVGTNDTVWQAINDAVYLNSYASLAAALADIGATQKQLIITEQYAVTGDTTIPNNVLVTFAASGSFTVSGGVTLNIGSLTIPPPRQVFYGAGITRIAKNGSGGYFHLSWWAGTDPTSDDNHALDQMIASLVANEGGTADIGPGEWRIAEQVFPNNSWIRGAGGNVDADGGTVLLPPAADSGAAFVAGVEEGFRNIVFENITFNADNKDASAFLISGTYPNSGFFVRFTNCTFTGGTDAEPIVKIDSLPGVTQWEAIGVYFDHCIVYVPENGVGFTCDTVNSSIYWTQPSFFVQVGGTAMGMGSFGFMDIINPDFRYIGDTPDPATTATDRSLNMSITMGTTDLTIDSGIFVDNDIGQRVVRDAKLDARIIDITSNTTAVVDTAASATVSNESVDIEYFEENPTIAYACITTNASFGSLNLIGGATEGFNYVLVTDNDTLFPAIYIEGHLIQGQIKLGGTRTLILKGCTMGSQVFQDESGVTCRIFSEGNTISDTSAIGAYAPQCNLLQARYWGIHDGSSVFYDQRDIQTGAPDFLHGPEPYQQMMYPLRLTEPVGATAPVLELATANSPTSGQLKIGQLDSWTQEITNYYTVRRDGTTGYLTFEGNQSAESSRYRGYSMNGLLQTLTDVCGVWTASHITTNLDDWTPTTRARNIRISTDASRTLTGINYNLPANFDGEQHEIWNIGSFNLVLQNQGGTSTAAYRFICDIGGDITLRPNERAYLEYDGTTQRWRVSKLNVSGVTSNGTDVVIDADLEVTGSVDIADALEVGGIATFSDSLIADAGIDCSGGLSILNGGDVAFAGTSGQNKISITDNLADSLSFVEGANPYLTFTTSNAAEKITAVKALVGSSSIKSTSPTQGIGFATGAGGSVVQATSKVTAFTLNTVCGQITFAGDQLDAGEVNSATWTNTAIAATDVVMFNHLSGGTLGAYWVNTQCGAGSATINIKNVTAGNLTEAPVFSFVVIKGVTS